MLQKNPTVSEWRRISLVPVDRFETLEVLLADDSVNKAVWTGAKWLSNGKPIEPKAWRVPTSDESVGEETKRHALEVLGRLPEKPPIKRVVSPREPIEPKSGWIKRVTFSVRNYLA